MERRFGVLSDTHDSVEFQAGRIRGGDTQNLACRHHMTIDLVFLQSRGGARRGGVAF